MLGLSYIASGADENKFTYNGKELEDEFGLDWYHYGARFYDPVVGRWWAVDPADQFMTPYTYVGNNPIMLIDPDGAVAESPNDIVYLHLDGTTQIVRTDDPFDILVDLKTGSISGTDVSMWENDSKIFSNFTNYFLFHDWVVSDQQRWVKAFNSAQREDIKEGLFMASMAHGSKNALITMTKIGATAAAGISTLGIGAGAITGSMSLVSTSSFIGSVSSGLSAGESALRGKYTTAAIKAGTGIIFNGAYKGILNNIYSNTAERGAMSIVTNSVEWGAGIGIGAVEN
jgi:RHS repeat-associated protein